MYFDPLEPNCQNTVITEDHRHKIYKQKKLGTRHTGKFHPIQHIGSYLHASCEGVQLQEEYPANSLKTILCAGFNLIGRRGGGGGEGGGGRVRGRGRMGGGGGGGEWEGGSTCIPRCLYSSTTNTTSPA